MIFEKESKLYPTLGMGVINCSDHKNEAKDMECFIKKRKNKCWKNFANLLSNITQLEVNGIEASCT